MTFNPVIGGTLVGSIILAIIYVMANRIDAKVKRELEEFGQHKQYCASWHWDFKAGASFPCDCGFDEARGEK